MPKRPSHTQITLLAITGGIALVLWATVALLAASGHPIR